MAGWSCQDRDLNHWDGTLSAKKLAINGQNLDDRYVNITGDTMTGDLTLTDASLKLKDTANNQTWAISQGTSGTKLNIVSPQNATLLQFDRDSKNLTMDSGQLKGVANPTAAQDVATKSYVDAVVLTDLSGGNHKMIYTNGSGAVVELTHGSGGHVLTSNGATSAPSWEEIPVPSIPSFSQTQPSRALNTTYQNTTGATLIVYGSIRCVYSDDATVGNVAWFACKSDSSSPPTTVRHEAGCKVHNWVVTSNSVIDVAYPFHFIVANNHYYRIDSTTNGGATVTLNYWNEVENLERN